MTFTKPTFTYPVTLQHQPAAARGLSVRLIMIWQSHVHLESEIVSKLYWANERYWCGKRTNRNWYQLYMFLLIICSVMLKGGGRVRRLGDFVGTLGLFIYIVGCFFFPLLRTVYYWCNDNNMYSMIWWALPCWEQKNLQFQKFYCLIPFLSSGLTGVRESPSLTQVLSKKSGSLHPRHSFADDCSVTGSSHAEGEGWLEVQPRRCPYTSRYVISGDLWHACQKCQEMGFRKL